MPPDLGDILLLTCLLALLGYTVSESEIIVRP